MVLGNHPCLPPVDLALPENPKWFCLLLASRPLCVLLSLCSRPTVLARLLDCLLGFRRCVVAAFFVLVGVLVVVLSRVVPWFAVGGDIDARGLRNCAIFTCLFLCLYDRPHRPSLSCLELLLHLFRNRSRS